MIETQPKPAEDILPDSWNNIWQLTKRNLENKYLQVFGCFCLTVLFAAIAKDSLANQQKPVNLPDLINNERVANGLKPLAYSPALSNAAANECNAMVTQDKTALVSPKAGQPWSAYFTKEAIYNAYIAEDVVYGSTDTSTISRDYKTDALNPHFTMEGLAACVSPDFRHKGSESFVVLDLAGPAPKVQTRIGTAASASQ